MIKDCNKLQYYEIWVKPKFTRFGIREMVRIVLAHSAKDAIDTWILPEFKKQVYAFKSR